MDLYFLSPFAYEMNILSIYHTKFCASSQEKAGKKGVCSLFFEISEWAFNKI